MLSRIRSRLTYANVMATVAVFIALGGSAYAAIKITGKNVKNGTLTGADVKNNSLTSKDVKSLGANDFKGGALPTGPRGPRGLTGPQGPGAKRFWVDTGVGKPAGTVYTAPDFAISVDCSSGHIWVERRAPANVAVNAMRIDRTPTEDIPAQTSAFLNGSPVRVQIAAAPANGAGSGDAIIQSYSPGTDTARMFSVQAAISDEPGPGACAAFGVVIPAS